MTLTIEDFDEFFAHVHGAEAKPFAWQRRLLRHLVDGGRWPEQVTAPTGAGKTAVIDVHVFALALMSAGAARRLPRRLALVVDRRVLVDDQYEHARTLQRLLAEAEDRGEGVLALVAASLRELRSGDPDGPPLVVSRLRGGMPPARAWRDDPTACQILCCTPDMWGSRLLFGGYGTSRLAQPRETGLLSFDSVVVIDEAQLSRQLVRTARRAAELTRIAEQIPDVPTLQVVETTATPDPAAGTALGVQADDLEQDEQLRRRLTRPKPVDLLELPTWPLPRTGAKRTQGLELLAERAAGLLEEYGATVGCFMNTVKTALDLAKLLEKRGHVQVVCGRMRTFDLDRLREVHPGLLSIAGDDQVDFLVSTQSLEVGADLDWPAALTEIAPGTALAQRAGRVNRRGKRAHGRLVVAVPATEIPKDGTAPYEATDLGHARQWLDRRAADPLGLAPIALATDPAPAHAPRRILLQRPELGDAWLWARTSDAVFDQSDLDLWLTDDLTPAKDVGVVVRHRLPADTVDAVRLIRALPPVDYEVIPAQLTQVAKALDQRFGPETGPDGDGGQDALPQPLVVRQDDVTPYDGRLRAGDVIVVDDRTQMFTNVAGIPILDLDGDQAATDVLEGPAKPRPGELIARLGTGSLLDREPSQTAGGQALLDAAASWLNDPGSRQAHDDVADIIAKLATELRPEPLAERFRAVSRLLKGPIKNSDVIVHLSDDAIPQRLIVVDRRTTVLDEETRQQWTPSARAVPLDQHSDAVAERSGDIARRLGLDSLAGLLHLAGQHHDAGKQDPRFQMSLGATPQGPILAKSAMNGIGQIRDAAAASGLPRGWRHEQLSVLAAWTHLDELEPAERYLVARLIGTSHGRGRHGFPHTARQLLGDTEPTAQAVTLFDDGEWDHLIEHTHAVFGIWGCAYLEALIRAADGQISAEGS